MGPDRKVLLNHKLIAEMREGRKRNFVRAAHLEERVLQLENALILWCQVDVDGVIDSCCEPATVSLSVVGGRKPYTLLVCADHMMQEEARAEKVVRGIDYAFVLGYPVIQPVLVQEIVAAGRKRLPT